MSNFELMCPAYEGNIDGQLDLFICESAALLTTNAASKLLCGLRGGTVIVLDLKWGRCKLTIHCLVACSENRHSVADF